MARDFNGTSNFEQETSLVWTGTDDISIFFWSFVPSPDQNCYTLLFGAQTSAPSPTDRISTHAPWSDGILYWDYGNSTAGSGRLSTSFVSSMDKWTAVGLLATAAPLMRIYLDGAQAATQNARGSPTDKTGLVVGTNVSPGGAFHKGRIAYLTVWKTGLTANEFAMLAAGAFPLTIRPDKIFRFHPMFGVEAAEPDWGPNKAHLTLSSAPARIDHPYKLWADFFNVVLRTRPLPDVIVGRPSMFNRAMDAHSLFDSALTAGGMFHKDQAFFSAGGAQVISGAGGIATGFGAGTAKLNMLLLPSGIASAEVVGAPKVTQSVSASGIVSAEASGAPKVNIQIRASGISSAEALGVPVVSMGGMIIGAGNIASAEAFGTARLNQKVLAGSIASSEASGIPRVNLQVRPSGVPTGEASSAPRLNMQVRPVSIASGQALGSPRLNEQARPVSIGTGEAFGQPRFNRNISGAGGIASAQAVGTPIVTVQSIVQLPSRLDFGHVNGSSISRPSLACSKIHFGRVAASTIEQGGISIAA